MADVVDAATRSRMMAGIRSKNTRPEMIIRRALHARGFRYSLHSKDLPGKPDIVMPKWRVVLFVHGCFWHMHGCSLSQLPQGNADFWSRKLFANLRRDEVVKRQLTDSGWRIATIWECATKGKKAVEGLPDATGVLADWIRDLAESPTIEIPAKRLQTQTRPAAGN